MKRLGGGFDMNKMMKQVEKAQVEVKRLQEEAGGRTVEATSGGGMVRVTVNGKLEVLNIEIKPEVVDPEDIEMLQDLIVAGVNEGLKKAQELMNEEMAKIKIPGLM